MINKTTALLLFLIFLVEVARTQEYIHPVAIEKSHAELRIERFERNSDYTRVVLSIVNKRNSGGWFCASEDIRMELEESGKVLQLMRAENIPICPDKHSFKQYGEKLVFELYFPPVPKDVMVVNIDEHCSQACFYLHEVVLSNDYSMQVQNFEQAIQLLSEEAYEEAIALFKQTATSKMVYPSSLYALSYYYLVLANEEMGNQEMAKSWVEKLKVSDVFEKTAILKKLKEMEY